MHIGAKARVVFMNNVNTAGVAGGAVSMSDGMITVGTESCVTLHTTMQPEKVEHFCSTVQH